jgi:hypothetical protein
VDGVVSHDSSECWNSTCGLEVVNIELHSATVVSNNGHRVSNPVQIRDGPRLTGKVRSGFLRISGKVQIARWRPHAADTTNRYYRKQSANWVYTTSSDGGEVQYILSRTEAEAFALELQGDIPFWQPTSPEPNEGPETYSLLDINDTKLGLFIPDCSMNLPGELYCLHIKLEPEEMKLRLDPYSLWLIRGIALTPVSFCR